MKITLQQTIKTSYHGMVSTKVAGSSEKLVEIRNFVIFHEDMPEETLAEKSLSAFPELLAISFNDHQTFNTIYTRDE